VTWSKIKFKSDPK